MMAKSDIQIEVSVDPEAMALLRGLAAQVDALTTRVEQLECDHALSAICTTPEGVEFVVCEQCGRTLGR